MVSIAETLQKSRMLELIFCLACNYVNLDICGEIELILHRIHWFWLCSHEYGTAVNLQENLLA